MNAALESYSPAPHIMPTKWNIAFKHYIAIKGLWRWWSETELGNKTSTLVEPKDVGYTDKMNLSTEASKSSYKKILGSSK